MITSRIIAYAIGAGCLSFACAVMAQQEAQGPIVDAGTEPADATPESVAGQTPTPEQESLMDEIIVTSQRRGERLQDVPISMSAATADMLADAGIVSQAQLPRIVPNLAYNVSSTFVSPYLRGIGTEFANAGLEPAVAIYLDDSYITRPSFGLVSFSDVDRVEVLKGPQGTLYGRNATGGLLRIITKDPTHEFEARTSLTYGRFDRVSSDSMVNIPFSDALSGRFNFSSDRNDGYVENTESTRPDMQDRDLKFFNGKLLWEASDNLRFKLSGDYANKDDTEGAGWIPLNNSAPGSVGIALGGTPSPGFYKTSLDYYGDGFHTRNGGSSLRGDWTLDSMVLSTITSYRYAWEESHADLDTVDVPLLHAVSQPAKTQTYAQELQAVSTASGPLKWVGGLYYYREDSRHRFAVFGSSINQSFEVPDGPDVGTIDGGVALVSDGYVEVESIAPYAQATYAFTSQWDLTLGARYTSETKKVTRHDVAATGLGGDPLVLLSEAPRKLDFNEFTPKATVGYRPIEDTLLYASYSRGFKSGGFNIVSLSAVDEVKPEVLDAFEVGLKMERGRLRLNAATFYYDYQDLTVQVVDNTGLSRTENAANARIYGAEADLTAALTPRLELGAGLGLLHSEYRNYTNGSIYIPAEIGFATASRDLSGNHLTQAPSSSGHLRAQYEQSLPRDIGSLRYSSILSYASSFYFDNANQIREPERYLLSATVAWVRPDDRFRVELFGDNLLDEQYRYTAAESATGGFYIPAPPLTWGLKITLTY